jgi:AcrR family transcriptional regulator
MPRLAPAQLEERRTRILDAAERCFAREGFHRTTMQHICAETGYSPGALYRYFDSKEALIAGLCERDRAMVETGFRMVEEAPDVRAAFEALGRWHLVEEPREKAVVAVAIWAEATRSPDIAAICESFDADMRDHMGRVLVAWRAQRGWTVPVDMSAITSLFLTLADGLYKRRALEPGFDGPSEIVSVVAILEAALSGNLPLGTPGPTPGGILPLGIPVPSETPS